MRADAIQPESCTTTHVAGRRMTGVMFSTRKYMRGSFGWRRVSGMRAANLIDSSERSPYIVLSIPSDGLYARTALDESL